jgi:hypothetical protein
MARRTAHAQPANRGDADPWRTELRRVDPRGERAIRNGRERRALEGQLVGRIRTQARQRRAPQARSPASGFASPTCPE